MQRTTFLRLALLGVTAAALGAAPAAARLTLVPNGQDAYGTLAPAAGVPKAKAVAPPPAAAEPPTPAPAAAPPPTPAAAPAPVTDSAPAEAATEPKIELPTTPEKSAAPVQIEPDDSTAVPPDQIPAKPVVNAKGELIVGVSAVEDSAILRFPFTQRVAMAAFGRSRHLWIVFNGNYGLDLSEFEKLPATVLSKPVRIEHDRYTILRIKVDDNVYPFVLREDGSTGWTVQITQKKRPLAEPLKAVLNTEPPAPAHVFISVQETADPINVKDPKIGDDIVIVPLFVPGQGMPVQREFVEFSLPRTAQGIAVTKKADDVEVTQLRNGLRVGVPQGSTLSKELPDVQPEKAAATLFDNSTFFPYELWKPDNPDNMHAQVNRLFHQTVESKTPQEGNDARLRLAQIYLSQGMAPEALGMLDGIQRINPAFYRSAKLAALRGAANMLMYRFPEAAQDFSAAELNNSKEAEYWRSMLADLLGGNSQGYDYMTLNQDYISKYPPLFRQRLAIFAADRSIGTKNYSTAMKIFDVLQKDNIIAPINHYINFLLAKISADTGQQKEANEIWDKLAEDTKRYPFVAARAEFSRIAWAMENAKISKDDAIDRLERLRLAWHGDNLELNVIVLLGDLYLEKQDYVNAMRIWHGGIQSFANTAEAVTMTRKMQSAFITMFNEGAADSLPPLDSLALYYEYRKYTPPGIAGGEMVERLADRLVSVDLLDQAFFVLDQQMRTQAEKDTRSRIGAKLATIALLNNQPKKVITALEDSVYGENEPILRQLRNRLAAQAMAEIGMPEKALFTLGRDTTEDAERIRLFIYWQAKDWPNVITSAENILKMRKDITAQLTLDESDVVIRLALAYAFENDNAQLQYLRDYFTPLMENNPQKPVFEFITTPDLTPTPTNFDEIIQNMADTRSFIKKYKARIAIDGFGNVGKTF